MPFQLTRGVKLLLIINFAVFVVERTIDLHLGGNLLEWFALVPHTLVHDFRVWQLFTYQFLHADVMHLFLNGLMLFFLGGELEATWGMSRFFRYYFFCGVMAGVFYMLVSALFWSPAVSSVPMVGASGAIYGLLVAYGILFGERTILVMLLFPMKAKHVVGILALVEFMTTMFSPGANALSSLAHLGGMGAGFGFLWFRAWKQIRDRQKRRFPGGGGGRRRRRKKADHLQLVINREDRFDRDSDDDTPRNWH